MRYSSSGDGGGNICMAYVYSLSIKKSFITYHLMLQYSAILLQFFIAPIVAVSGWVHYKAKVFESLVQIGNVLHPLFARDLQYMKIGIEGCVTEASQTQHDVHSSDDSNCLDYPS
uniref:Uncharacterized protein n=1 Tax=Glossina austeni TaxID=7395 RepID=A0A1A9V3E0_GLOAU